MKRIVSFVIALAALGVFASACSKKATPGTPSNSQPTTFFFHADALPANELAPNNVPSGHAEAAGRAFASVTLKVTRDGAGTITNGTLDYGVAVSSFPAGTNFTNMHIHRGDATVSGACAESAIGVSARTSADTSAWIRNSWRGMEREG